MFAGWIHMSRAKKPKPIDHTRAAEHDHANCKALGRVLDRIGDKWTVMVVGALSKGPMRFNALLRFIDGVSHRMLTLTLRGLEHDGLVKRTVYPSVPAKVEYELTAVGASLVKPLGALSDWVQKNQPAIEAARASRGSASDTRTLDPELPRPAKGRAQRDTLSARTPTRAHR
jgi:DNA-binding HxlR family transcriptional regulator